MFYTNTRSPVKRTENADHRPMDSDRERRLWADYGHTLETYRQLAEIRFKLLALVPAVSGAAVALLTKAAIDSWEKVALACVGLLVTLGIVLYDQRNTQFYNGAIGRAQHLEAELELDAFEGDEHPGLFGSRDDHAERRMLLLPVRHGLGLALVYSPVLGAWVFAAVQGGGGPTWAALVAGAGAAALVFLQLEWNDGRARWLRRRPAERVSA
jgi:hypothetical protein